MPDGSLGLTAPAWEDKLVGFGKTAHGTMVEWYEWAVTHNIPEDWVSLGEVDVSALPPDRDFRSCWRYDGAAVRVDSVLEVGERWQRIRVERDRRLAESDGLMARANETGVKIAEWKAYRQALRDIPQAQPDLEAITWPMRPA